MPKNSGTLFGLRLFRTPTFPLGLLSSLPDVSAAVCCRLLRQSFCKLVLVLLPFHAGLMMLPMVLGSMGMKRTVEQIVNRFGYRWVLVGIGGDYAQSSID